MQMLIGHHLGVKGKIANLLAEKNEKAVKVKEVVDGLLSDAKKAIGFYQLLSINSSLPSLMEIKYLFIIQKSQIRLLKHLTSQGRNLRHIYV